MKNNLPIITHGEGVYLYDTTGRKYLDWTSQAVCTNGGHTVSENIKSAVLEQVRVGGDGEDGVENKETT
jgi:adenosylmethionine-8-amino-7-oxononanoate aminotransferase